MKQKSKDNTMHTQPAPCRYFGFLEGGTCELPQLKSIFVQREWVIKSFLTDEYTTYSIPLYASKVQAGFPSPADDYVACSLDLNQALIRHPSATFILIAIGESMIDAGIHPGDKPIVDRSVEAVDGKIVIAALDGELTVKRLSRKANRVQLLPANPKFKPIDSTEDSEMMIWGVVMHIIHTPS
jgi:DNA polymerase V